MKRFALSVLCIITIIVGIVLPGCTSGTTSTVTSTATKTATSTVAAKSLTFAIVTPLTATGGGPTNVALNYQRAVEEAVSEVNAEGGVTIGGQPYIINTIVRDDKFDQATAKSVADEVVLNEKVPVIFGPSQNEGPALQDVTNANKVLMFCMSPSPNMTSTDYPYNFFLGGIVSQQYATVLEYITKYYPTAKNVITFYADLNDADLEAGGAEDMCKFYGLNWLGIEKYPMGTSDFASFAQKLMSYNPDIIDLSGGGGATGALMGTVITQIRQAGYTGIIMMPTVPPPGIMDTIPATYLNKIVTNDINIDGTIVTAQYKELINGYYDKYGEYPIDFYVQAYNGVSAFLQFLNTQNTMDTEQWMQNFVNYTWTGVYGEKAQWVGEPVFGINRALMTNFWTSEWKNGVLETSYVNELPTQLWISGTTPETWYPNE